MDNEKRKELEEKRYKKQMKTFRILLFFQFLLSLYILFYHFCRFYIKHF